MSAITSGLFNGSSRSQWVVNQALSSAEMVEKMVKAELRRGEFGEIDARVSRIEELVKEHLLDAEHERRLLLLAARFLDAAGETRRAYRIAGLLMSDKDRLGGAFYADLRRFRTRLALNRNDLAEARKEINLTERTVTEIPERLGQVKEQIDTNDLSQVTVPTWLLSAEVSLGEGDYRRGLQYLANAR